MGTCVTGVKSGVMEWRKNNVFDLKWIGHVEKIKSKEYVSENVGPNKRGRSLG